MTSILTDFKPAIIKIYMPFCINFSKYYLNINSKNQKLKKCLFFIFFTLSFLINQIRETIKMYQFYVYCVTPRDEIIIHKTLG